MTKVTPRKKSLTAVHMTWQKKSYELSSPFCLKRLKIKLINITSLAAHRPFSFIFLYMYLFFSAFMLKTSSCFVRFKQVARHILLTMHGGHALHVWYNSGQKAAVSYLRILPFPFSGLRRDWRWNWVSRSDALELMVSWNSMVPLTRSPTWIFTVRHGCRAKKNS